MKLRKKENEEIIFKNRQMNLVYVIRVYLIYIKTL